MTATPAHMACCQPSTNDSFAARISACAWAPVPSAAPIALATPSRAVSAASRGTPSSWESMALR
ncbi:hypothetical protein [Streptomyces sp. NPDC058268]|uniref:hypothetical protein n=1 Tax=Streptomyces sp. NPDC058268 TaxID=3346413 RepID=UPI0036E6279E